MLAEIGILDVSYFDMLEAHIAKVLNENLTEKQIYIMTMRYGLDITEVTHTYQEIADALLLTKERIRQILQKSLRTLRRSNQARQLSLASQQDIYELKYELKDEIKRLKSELMSIRGSASNYSYSYTSEPIPDISIDELELSVRTEQTMYRMKIKNLRDLVRKTESDLLRQRNFGKVSLEEVKATLAKKGLKLEGKPDNTR